MTPIPRHDWVKSSYSNQDGGDCLEWAPSHAQAHGVVPVRDSKCPQGPTLSLSTDGWDAFVSRVKDAEFPAP
ncbi:DUF397 domain-containing protein [Streptomyces scopuliridis]|uniref:DUF397 domain-containing protein n=1 Tax=Streptomyces scopuliridis TaxID=452529 RepID=UPI002DDB3D7B|nr:DUF397 domain-containing protein [Streptomyces scopuliridis]WSB34529.1 DUF397 domain-containing protein [Streptomyces scopuliridis]